MSTPAIDPRMRYTRAELKEAQLEIAHMICDLIRSGHQAEAEEAIRQAREVGERLGLYPPNGAVTDEEREALGALMQEIH